MISFFSIWMLLALLQGMCAASYISLHENGTDNPSCLEGKMDCKTFDFLVQQSSFLNHYTICINSTLIHLQKRYAFVDVHNITLVGLGQHKTVLQCEHESEETATTGVGLHFYNSTNIRLSSFSLKNCDAMVENSSARGAVAFHHCNYTAVSEVSFNESQGYGLILDNTGGQVYIAESLFSYNGFPSSHLPQEELSHGAGGMDIYATSVSHSNYQVFKCNFTNNIANTSKNLTGVASSGGGISIILENITKINTVEIVKCKFEKNTGLHGGAIHLLFLGESAENNITFDECLFKWVVQWTLHM